MIVIVRKWHSSNIFIQFPETSTLRHVPNIFPLLFPVYSPPSLRTALCPRRSTSVGLAEGEPGSSWRGQLPFSKQFSLSNTYCGFWQLLFSLSCQPRESTGFPHFCGSNVSPIHYDISPTPYILPISLLLVP